MSPEQIRPEQNEPVDATPTAPTTPPLRLPVRAPVLLAPSQENAFAQLRALANVFFSTCWHDLPFRPRLTPLVVGPSGTGKSFLAQFLASTFSAGFLRISYGEWIPLGARSSPYTHAFDRVHRLLCECRRAVIFIDELEKMRVDRMQEWSNCIMQELFLLLDRAPSITSQQSSWQPQAIQTLLHNTFIIGAGAWQEAWTTSRRAAFSDEPAEEETAAEIVRRIEASAKIPEELLKRFDGRLILIPHYTAEDFRHALAGHNQHVSPELHIEITPRLIEELVASRRNMRAVQETISQRLLQKASEDADFLQTDIPF